MDVTAEDYDLYPDGLLPIPAKKLADLLVLSAFLPTDNCKAAYYKGLVGDADLDSEEEDSEEEQADF